MSGEHQSGLNLLVLLCALYHAMVECPDSKPVICNYISIQTRAHSHTRTNKHGYIHVVVHIKMYLFPCAVFWIWLQNLYYHCFFCAWKIIYYLDANTCSQVYRNRFSFMLPSICPFIACFSCLFYCQLEVITSKHHRLIRRPMPGAALTLLVPEVFSIDFIKNKRLYSCKMLHGAHVCKLYRGHAMS